MGIQGILICITVGLLIGSYIGTCLASRMIKEIVESKGYDFKKLISTKEEVE